MRSTLDDVVVEKLLIQFDEILLLSLSHQHMECSFQSSEWIKEHEELGHQIYIITYQLYKKFSDKSMNSFSKVVAFYSSRTAKIEIVRSDSSIEQIVFPVPEVCQFLKEESKKKFYLNAEEDDEGYRASYFLRECDGLIDEIHWQKYLQKQPFLYFLSNFSQIWLSFIFWLSIGINIIVVQFYPFGDTTFEFAVSVLGIFLLFFKMIYLIGFSVSSCKFQSHSMSKVFFDKEVLYSFIM